MAPAQPRTWLRIAQARSWLRYPPEQVIDALKMAIFTGRVEPSMLLTRLALGLAFQGALSNFAAGVMLVLFRPELIAGPGCRTFDLGYLAAFRPEDRAASPRVAGSTAQQGIEAGK